MKIFPLSETRIRGELSPPARALLARLDLVGEIDSTNQYLLDAARNDAVSGSVCLAESQTAGRGRRGRRWVAPNGNLCMSFLWRFAGEKELSGLSLAVGAMVVDALRRTGFSALELKWPNDVLCRRRKLAGILVESITEAGEKSVVVGIGVNYSMPRADAASIDQEWTDVVTEIGSGVTRDSVAGRVADAVLIGLDEFSRRGIAPFRSLWEQHDVAKGHHVVIKNAGENVREGRAQGIDETGALLLSVDGRLERIIAGDLSLRVVD